MNASEKYKFIWWGTAGCGSRTVSSFFRSVGVGDLYNYVEGFYDGRGRSFTHSHGFPEGKEDWDVVCNVRNPYSLLVSSYLDIYTERKEHGIELKFIDFLKNDFFYDENMRSDDPFFLNVWKKLHKEPEYIIHMEDMERDLRNLPYFEHDEKFEMAIDNIIKKNNYKNGSPYDEYEGQFQKFKRFYNQEIADIVYDNMKEYFIKFGYDKDSWK